MTKIDNYFSKVHTCDLSFIDRLRVLFGGTILVKTELYKCDEVVPEGVVKSVDYVVNCNVSIINRR